MTLPFERHNRPFAQALTRRKNIHNQAKLPLLHIIGSARITVVRPIRIGDYCIVLTESGLKVACSEYLVQVHAQFWSSDSIAVH